MKVFLSIFFAIFVCHIFAHSGGTDSDGGHFNRSTGDYHYHHGYPPHSHENGCPYDYDDDGHKAKSRTSHLDNVYQKTLGEAQYFFWLKLGVSFSVILGLFWGIFDSWVIWGIKSSWGLDTSWEDSNESDMPRKYFLRIVLLPTFVFFFFYPIYYSLVRYEILQAFHLLILNLLVLLVVMTVAFLLASIIQLIKNGVKNLKNKIINSKLLAYTVSIWDKIKGNVILFFIFLFFLVLITGPFTIGPYLRSNKNRAPHPQILEWKKHQDEMDSINNEIERTLKSIKNRIDSLKLESMNKTPDQQ